MPAQPDQQIVHASAVALGDRGVLIQGASGAGKSGLALTLMAYGATLVADDRVILTRRGDRITMAPPETIAGKIEARGIGILAADFVEDAELQLMVDMDLSERDRLPPQRSTNMLGISIPLLHNIGTAHFAPSILQYLRKGREA